MATNNKNTAAPELYHFQYLSNGELILSFRGAGTPLTNLQLFNDANKNGINDTGEQLANRLVGANGQWALDANVGVLTPASSFFIRSVENTGFNVSEITSLTFTPPKPTAPVTLTTILRIDTDRTVIAEPGKSESVTASVVSYSLSQGTPNGLVQLSSLGNVKFGDDISFTPVNLNVVVSDAATQTATIRLDAQGNASFRVTALEDKLVEGTENLLINATDLTTAISRNASVSVLDNTDISITRDQNEISEPTGNITQTIYTISGPANTVFSVRNTGTAKVGADVAFTALSGVWSNGNAEQQSATVTLDAQGQASFILAALADSQVEGDENLVLAFSDGTRNFVDTPIPVHDTLLKITANPSEIFESNGAASTVNKPTQVSYIVTGAPNQLVTLHNSGTAIIGNDLGVLPVTFEWLNPDLNKQSASFRLNAQGTASFTFVALADDLVEGNETLVLDVTDSLDPANKAAAGTVILNDAVITPLTPVLSFSAPSVQVTEGNGQPQNQATLTVNLSAAASQPVTVNYSNANGSATADSDYQAVTGTLTFAPGETSKTIPVNIFGDTVVEPDENFTVALANASSNAVLGAPSNATVTVKNDDAVIPTISFAQAGVSVTEGNGQPQNQATLTVNLSAAASQPVTVNYATANGSSIADSDYQAATGTLTFAPGETSKTIPVNIFGDMVVEPDENFTVALANASSNAVLGAPSNATVTVKNDDAVIPTISFAQAGVSVTEGNGQPQNQAILTVSLSGTATQAVTVSYETNHGTATLGDPSVGGGDYVDTIGTLTFAPGETSKTISVPIVGDTTVEQDEDFTVSLSNPSANATLGAPNNAAVTIINDDTLPVLGFNATSVSVVEGTGNNPANLVTLTVALSAPANQTISINYATQNGTAIGTSSTPVTAVIIPADFQSASGTLSFAPGETTKTISIPIAGDATFEQDESFAVILSNLVGNATLGTSNANVTITNDDQQPIVSFASASTSAIEGNLTVTGAPAITQVPLTVNLSAASTQTVTVSYATQDGTAVSSGTANNPADYQPASGTITFKPGETSQTINVAVIGDVIDTIDENFAITLVGVSNATLGSPNGMTITITNDDLILF